MKGVHAYVLRLTQTNSCGESVMEKHTMWQCKIYAVILHLDIQSKQTVYSFLLFNLVFTSFQGKSLFQFYITVNLTYHRFNLYNYSILLHYLPSANIYFSTSLDSVTFSICNIQYFIHHPISIHMIYSFVTFV